ncbi:SMI1/KNR4 family protein [Chryseobacterium mucoviscidosis]|uniref:SMI1/KNR4 family protein n=1 Tax=unclassified Paenibacillus TaxID=185978 RepID=UPI0009A25FBD|nr:SMI1/KNR4 family protein [Paenibacillus sp. 11B]MDN8588361.1 SMI1/KNR4 family protein [Paenibacillus sp. 11B]OPG95233.1 SMI1/KNR4 family protein [Chryseobacterium mucoviscidosis]
MDRVNERITINDIREFESKYVLNLPEQYVDFLLKYNGGYLEESTFKISDEEGESVINKFYGIGNMKGNLGKVFEVLDGELPGKFISIANDPGGNEICIGTGEKHFGENYFWIHDMESDEEMENMFFLKSSFNDFFDNLY